MAWHRSADTGRHLTGDDRQVYGRAIFSSRLMKPEIPSGYYTRPRAAELFNRSQRSLERDLDLAQLAKDTNVLQNYKLITKDGQLREGTVVTTEEVNKLVEEGESPVWIVNGNYLEREFGRKGSPKPGRSQQASDANRSESNSDQPIIESDSSTSVQSEQASDSQSQSLPNDIDLLKRYINRLEEQFKSERERHDRYVEVLFDQLTVKDKQISAWDELTMGISKGLATGQLTPASAADTTTNAGESSSPKFVEAVSAKSPSKDSAESNPQPEQKRSGRSATKPNASVNSPRKRPKQKVDQKKKPSSTVKKKTTGPSSKKKKPASKKNASKSNDVWKTLSSFFGTK